MKTKIIPFDLETAKKIQAGEIKGKINTRYGQRVSELLVFQTTTRDLYVVYANIDGKIHSFNADGYERIWDKSNHWKGDLVLEVPDNEPQKPQFKPFDKVLVRITSEYGFTIEPNRWIPAIFQASFNENSSNRCFLASGILWRECIAFEGNEHLVGTTNKPKE